MHEVLLIVEDRIDTLNMLAVALAKRGFITLTATCGREGLDKLRKSKVDLVILDMMLPDISGEEVLAEIRKHKEYSHVRVVILTALNMTSAEQKALLKKGAQAFLMKPVTIDMLEAELKKALKKG